MYLLFWVWGSKFKIKLNTFNRRLYLKLIGVIQTTVLLSHIQNLHIYMYVGCGWRVGILLVLDHWQKGQCQVCHSPIKHRWYDTSYSFCLITFKLHTIVVFYERRIPIDYGSGFQGEIWCSFFKSRGHDTDYSFVKSHSKLHT